MTRTADLDDPSSPNGKEILTPPTRAAWRVWLASNPERHEGLWVVYRKKSSNLEGPIYDDLVEEALCFGWIDSQTRRVDDDRVIQWFSPRRKGGLWSTINKARIERLVEQGLMTEAGQSAIDAAKADGSFTQADEVDALIVPADLEAALDAAPGAKTAYQALADSAKRNYLWWIHTAKRADTRAGRIEETIRRLSPETPNGPNGERPAG
ncbi:MAG TPA: YdeI/OmpD-associated family protein [Acidimicrobiia bacterium]|nr:YdeI/OmpD-associated family protein [Acidimicrobiia bacterium]